jgi:SAM-dependent methyltransferase
MGTELLERSLDRSAHLEGCLVCGADAVAVHYRFDDFAMLRCRACEAGWRSNMYTPEDIVEMYCEEDYENHPFFSYDGSDETLERTPRFRRFQRALDVIEAETGAGRLLDVGCGAGTFMSVAQRRGWDVHGVEISAALSELAEQATGQGRVTTAAFEDIEAPEVLYDAVTMWDVIEHVLDPVAFVDKARSLLRPGGVLVACTPDEDSLLASTARVLYRATRGRYSYPALALHPRYHTFFFSRRSLSRLFERAGMDVVATYSQEAFASHSDLASGAQKTAIAAVERIGRLRDSCYECVVFARS